MIQSPPVHSAHHTPSGRLAKYEAFFRRLAPEYRNRWDTYNELVSSYLAPERVWLDIGCGDNSVVSALGPKSGIAVGVDLQNRCNREQGLFVEADLHHLPFRTSSADVVTMRMVVEHLRRIPEEFSEIERVARPGCNLIILTTHRRSPFVIVSNIFPFGMKQWLIRKLFDVEAGDILPTYHALNTRGRMNRGAGRFKIREIYFLEQVPLDSFIKTLIFGGWYLITHSLFPQSFRSNILALFQKFD